MNDIPLMLSMLVNSEYRNDKVLSYMGKVSSCDREAAVTAYSQLCETLLDENMTLSEHIFHLAADKAGKHFEEYMRSGSVLLRVNIGKDMNILSRLAAVTPGELIAELRARFSFEADFPYYENGNTVIITESVADYKRRYGISMFERDKAFIWSENTLVPVQEPDRISLAELKNYETQRKAVIDNTLCFINGQKHSNVLLYGDRGTGKSSTVKAIVNEYPGLRILFVQKKDIPALYDIYDCLRAFPLKFIIFLDDVNFTDGDPEYGILKQALEGSVKVMPENCVIYATTNRRHLIKESSAEHSDEQNGADARDEKASLADRFGLYITFFMPDKKTYLDIVKQMAADRELGIPEDKLIKLAERFAVRKNGRSPRTARQFVDILKICRRSSDDE